MSKNLFNSVQLKKPRRNKFDLTHDVKFSGKMGQLVPVCLLECVPDDKHILGCENMVRLAPMVAPIMHRVDVSMHYFFVPNRIIWKNWEKFISQRGDDVPAFPTIQVETAGGRYTRLLDYMGIPNPIDTKSEVISALPFAAYQMIFNEYYRDENLVPEVDFELVDGDNSANTGLYSLRNRAWEHDYFTSCLPFAQKGGAVDLPLGDVTIKPDWQGTLPYNPHFVDAALDPIGPGALTQDASPGIQAPTGAYGAYDPAGSLEVSPTTLNDLRTAMAIQTWLERNARGGTRYAELIRAHFGVTSSDARLQRPEYITGTKKPVSISEVLNTTGTEDAPQGNMAGHGISVDAGKSGSYYCEEHGWIIGIMSVMPKTAYQQGIDRHFLKTDDAFQYYWPEYAHLGEQEVLNREVYAFQGGPGGGTFGYNPRYSEYKFMNSRVAGEFRTTQNFWHMGRIFETPPALNALFITSDPTTRVFAVEDPEVDNLYCHVLNRITSIRPMPMFGTPSFV